MPSTADTDKAARVRRRRRHRSRARRDRWKTGHEVDGASVRVGFLLLREVFRLRPGVRVRVGV